GVLQPPQGLSLGAETQQLLGVVLVAVLQHLQRDDAAELLVEGLVDDPHAARAEGTEDLVVADLLSRPGGQFPDGDLLGGQGVLRAGRHGRQRSGVDGHFRKASSRKSDGPAPPSYSRASAGGSEWDDPSHNGLANLLISRTL